MGPLGSPQAPLTLHACLAALAHLEERYILTSAGDEWSARDLLSWLKTVHPQLLQLSVYGVPPDANGEGAIYEVAQRGHLLPDVPLYSIRWRQGTMPPEEGSSARKVLSSGRSVAASPEERNKRTDEGDAFESERHP